VARKRASKPTPVRRNTAPVRVSNTQASQARRTVLVEMLKPLRLSSLEQAQVRLPQILSDLQRQGVINARTGKPYTARTIRVDLAETIGQWTYVKPQWNARVLLNLDSSWKDYVFWDALRRGTAAGYEISGPAFCLPASQIIAAYSFGRGINASLVGSAINRKMVALNETARVLPIREANGQPTQAKRNAVGQPSKNGKSPAPLALVPPKAKVSPGATDNVAWTNLQIKHMLERNQSFLLSTTVDEFCLGNQYVICNPDCTFSIASPETVTIEYSASDYRRVERVIIRTKMQNARTEDVYTDTKRTLTIKYYDGRPEVVEEYENLIGRIPIVHFANDRSANEIYGRPIYEGALPVMANYDDTYKNMREGVNMLANPIPLFYGLDSPEATKKDNSTAVQYMDADGNLQTEYKFHVDRQTAMFLGKGADGKMLAPQVGFTKDSLDALRQDFLLMLNETHIPEFIWGGAIASSKASTESQLPPFIQYIQFRRLMLEGQGADPALGLDARGGLLELIDIWLRMYKLLNPNIVVGPVQIEWPEIDLFGDQWKYMWATFMSSTGKITDETTLKLSGYIADPAGEVMKASGKKARVPAFDEYDAKLRQARLLAAQKEMEPPDNGEVWASDYGSPELDALYGRNMASNNDPSGINNAAAHQHAAGHALGGDEWNPFGPLFWFGEFGGFNG
jgi:hypothetical protein